MSSRELMEWSAFENVYGPLLLHERIDLGFAKVCYYLVSLLTNSKRRRYKLRDFLPGWITERMRHVQNNEKQLQAMFQFWAEGAKSERDLGSGR